MKLDILLVDLALVAAVVIPYILFILLGKKEGRKLKTRFSEEMQKHDLSLSEEDSWNNSIVGLDKVRAMILFVQKRKVDFAVEFIDLKEVRTCEIYTEMQTISREQDSEDILQKLGFQLKLNNGEFRFIELYNCEESYAQDYELKHAERWKKTINDLINVRSTLNSAA
ncbi:hypothetical protein [Salinimicrobium sp. HB62]|uniref:hypothetical protein n=1 Tax=Salinimicrobium sp. HB62 TaxID=3077781 RepID=UPI002D77DB5E|nr:hypothetical protein [Salinimicrobium sp. HB62]